MRICSHKDKLKIICCPYKLTINSSALQVHMKKVMLARHTMFLTQLGRENRRKKDEDCLIICKLPLVCCVDHIEMCRTCLLVCISCGFSLAMGWWKKN